MQGCFPEPEKDPVIQIASMVTVQGQSTPAVRNVMTLDQCAPIVGAEVMSFRTEQQMLKVHAPCRRHASHPIIGRCCGMVSTGCGRADSDLSLPCSGGVIL